jgi:DNA-binding CsgD family transcriptional regulator
MPAQLNSIQIDQLSRAIAALDTEEFCARLLAFLHACVTFDSAVMLAYPDDSTLVVLHDELEAGDRAGFDGPYRNGLYMLSPLYAHSRSGERGCFHISEIAPEGFTESEFYQIYYSTNNSIDQVAFLLQSAAGTPIALSLERTSSLGLFEQSELAVFAGLSELLIALVGQNSWPVMEQQASTHPDLHGHVQKVLSLFGSSVLTPREREVVRLILRGYPSKSVARELDISIQTEQVHRKNIYQKLHISSHSELFTLFFDAITLTPIGDTDPLLALGVRGNG